MCEKERERDGVFVCVCVRVRERETTALGCWRHALALLCVAMFVIPALSTRQSVCVCLFTCTLEGCLPGVSVYVGVCAPASPSSFFPYVCAVVHVAGEYVCVRVCVPCQI